MVPKSLILVTLLLNFSLAETQVPDNRLCYVLDGVLMIYGFILTVLYCRLKIKLVYINTGGYPQGNGGYQKGEGLYAGLTHHSQDTYETVKVQKKAMRV
ncbi:hypothetical protein UPYG_G00293560 [Umbra pygmaea]|uniref:Uncharacterized protein n=1 Tax=Umbra pygmaea TaxID=75934 RepID=A0ABD0WUK3_UMBPY